MSNSSAEANDYIPVSEAAVPRLEFHWRSTKEGDWCHGGECGYACEYNLILPLQKLDIRRTDAKDARTKAGELVVSLSITGASAIMGPFQPPFRDGVHAQWDRVHLGYLPVYAVYAGRARLLHPAGKPEQEVLLEQ